MQFAGTSRVLCSANSMFVTGMKLPQIVWFAPRKTGRNILLSNDVLAGCRPERRDGRFRFTVRQVGSEATAGRPWPRISSKPPQPQTKPGPHIINFTDQGPPKGERAMIETPVLILIVVMAIGAIVWLRAAAH
jgi:hypothetical protein